MSQKVCQCGATPRFHVVKSDRRGRRRRPMRERLACHFCGNQTSISSSRQALREEWNSAGWCGQAGVRMKGGGE